MATLAITDMKTTEFAGDYKMVVGEVTMAGSSDTVTLTDASNHISEIHSVFVTAKSGFSTAYLGIAATYSGLAITLTPYNAAGQLAGSAAGKVVALMVVGK